MDFEDKEVLITGAGSGIGQATALLFAASRMDCLDRSSTIALQSSNLIRACRHANRSPQQIGAAGRVPVLPERLSQASRPDATPAV